MGKKGEGKKRRKKGGSITLFALLFAAVMVGVAVAFNLLVRDHLRVSLILKYKMDALILASSVEAEIKYYLVDGIFTSREILLPGAKERLGIERVPLNGTGVELKLPERVVLSFKDSNGLISLETPEMTALANLLSLFTNDTKRVQIIIDSFLDWIDQDDLVRINGAERDYYRFQGLKYIPRNYPLQYKEEFCLIRGMDEQLCEKVSPFLTILPNSGFNPHTAPDEVLLAYLGLSDRDAILPLKKALSEKQVLSEQEVLALTGKMFPIRAEGIYYFPSGVVELTIQVYHGNKTIFTRRIGLRAVSGFNALSPYETYYLKEE